MTSAMNNAARPSASRRPLPPTATPEMPGPAAMLALLPGLWDEHHAHDLAALRAVRLKDEAAYAVADTAKDRCWARIKATQDLILSSQPVTLADAVAVLLMTHNEIEIYNDDDSERARDAVAALLHQAIPAIAFIAKAGGMPLAEVGRNYLTEAQAMIVRGEVVA